MLVFTFLLCHDDTAEMANRVLAVGREMSERTRIKLQAKITQSENSANKVIKSVC